MLMLFNKFWQFYCILTELIQNVVVLVPCLRRWEEKKKKKRSVLVSFDLQGSCHSLLGRELNFCRKKKTKKQTPPVFNKLDVVHRSRCRTQCALHGNRPRHAAKHKNTIQTKSRLMGRIITTRRFVPICVCIFWLNNFNPCSAELFPKPRAHTAVKSSWALAAHPCPYMMQQLQFTLSSKLHWDTRWQATQSHQ